MLQDQCTDTGHLRPGVPQAEAAVIVLLQQRGWTLPGHSQQMPKPQVRSSLLLKKHQAQVLETLQRES